MTVATVIHATSHPNHCRSAGRKQQAAKGRKGRKERRSSPGNPTLARLMMEWRDLKEFAGQTEEGNDDALSGVAKLMTSGTRFNDVVNFDSILLM